ncbi:hypothetical protein M3I01_018210 [Marinomonas sp. RSW2]|uniref:Uncharacterized protein n=1 Tax=Marinomonas maritima TaxID=2940935 RepID=A0ABT5WK21_9GAMM|nr:hypothetical protein [Marinomonas maritima]MDE8604799.1 hypothetical protein [Marinomonas maritima]
MKKWLIILFAVIGLQSAVANAENAFDHSLEAFLVNYAENLNLTAEVIAKVKSKDLSIKFLSYDWNLNKIL